MYGRRCTRVRMIKSALRNGKGSYASHRLSRLCFFVVSAVAVVFFLTAVSYGAVVFARLSKTPLQFVESTALSIFFAALILSGGFWKSRRIASIIVLSFLMAMSVFENGGLKSIATSISRVGLGGLLLAMYAILMGMALDKALICFQARLYYSDSDAETSD